MSYNTFNVMHWHFVDDQSWPLVSQTYPNFSKAGAYAPSAVYQPSDVAALVAYAFDRGIIIIPGEWLITTPGAVW